MAKRKSKPVTYAYLGGAFIHGVPARDLSAGEYAKHKTTIEEQQKLINRVLYEPVTVNTANEEVTP